MKRAAALIQSLQLFTFSAAMAAVLCLIAICLYGYSTDQIIYVQRSGDLGSGGAAGPGGATTRSANGSRARVGTGAGR